MREKYLLLSIVVVVVGVFLGCTIEQKNLGSNTKPLASMSSRELVDHCTTDMATEFHIHAHLTILVNGNDVGLPAEIGIDQVKNCMSSMHTHDPNGVIHVEAPVKKDFTLGDFFYKWNKPFSKDQILENKVDSEHIIKFFVNGKESLEFENLKIEDHQEIVINYFDLKIGSGKLPTPFDWKKKGV